MSTSAARTRPASRPERLHDARPDLRVVEGARPRRAVLAVALATLVVLLVAIIVPLVLNTQMAERSFQIRTLQLELNQLDAQAWTLQTSLQDASSPTSLEAAARRLGMVPAGSTGFITLSTGTVVGGGAAR